MTHPKVKKAARVLGISVITMIGHLHALWWWAVDHAPDGLISAYDPEEIADAVAWEGEIGAFFDALVNCGAKDCPGLLDKSEDGSLSIHDWEEHCSKDYEKRKKDAERLRRYRANKRSQQPEQENAPKHKQNDSDIQASSVRNAYETCTYDVRNADVRGEREKEIEIKTKTKDYPQSCASGDVSGAVLDDSKVPDTPEATPEKMATPHVGQLPEGGTPEKNADMSVGYPSEFEEFWEHYPRKVEKKVAFTAWKSEIKTAAQKAEAVRAAKNYAAHTRDKKTEAEYIKHGATFLHKERWRDWMEGPSQNGITDAEKAAVIKKYTDGEGQRDDRAILRELRAIERERGFEPTY